MFLTFDDSILTLCSSNITFDSYFVIFSGSFICVSNLMVPLSHSAVPISNLTVLLSHIVVPLFFLKFDSSIVTLSNTNIASTLFLSHSVVPYFLFSNLTIPLLHWTVPTLLLTVLLQHYKGHFLDVYIFIICIYYKTEYV